MGTQGAWPYGCSSLASVSDLFSTETQFHASGGLSLCPTSEAGLSAEALARSHLRWGLCGEGLGLSLAESSLRVPWLVLSHLLPQFPKCPPPAPSAALAALQSPHHLFWGTGWQGRSWHCLELFEGEAPPEGGGVGAWGPSSLDSILETVGAFFGSGDAWAWHPVQGAPCVIVHFLFVPIANVFFPNSKNCGEIHRKISVLEFPGGSASEGSSVVPAVVGLLLRFGFDPWPGNFFVPQAHPPQRKQNGGDRVYVRSSAAVYHARPCAAGTTVCPHGAFVLSNGNPFPVRPHVPTPAPSRQPPSTSSVSRNPPPLGTCSQ